MKLIGIFPQYPKIVLWWHHFKGNLKQNLNIF